MWCRQRGLQCTITRLRVVPHFSSGIEERAKRERAWKSPHARKGDTRREHFSLSPPYVSMLLAYSRNVCMLEINKPLFNMSFRSPLTQKSATSLDSATILSVIPPFWPNFMDIKLSGECFFKNPWKRSLTLSPESTSVILSIATNTQKKIKGQLEVIKEGNFSLNHRNVGWNNWDLSKDVSERRMKTGSETFS